MIHVLKSVGCTRPVGKLWRVRKASVCGALIAPMHRVSHRGTSFSSSSFSFSSFLLLSQVRPKLSS